MSQLCFDVATLNFDVETLRRMLRHWKNFGANVATMKQCRDIEISFLLPDFCLFFQNLFISTYSNYACEYKSNKNETSQFKY